MGFFDRFKRPAKPEALGVTPSEGVVLAPVSGEEIRLEDSSDPVFSCLALGKGCAIKPGASVVYAPVSGTLTAAGAPNFHAIGITSDDGVEVLIHVGVNTVEMHGEGFEVFVEKDAHVRAGEPLLRFSAEKIRAAGHDDAVLMAITNTDDYSSVEPAELGEVSAGSPALIVRR